MRFDFDDEQRQIKETAREFLARHASPERVRAAAESGQPDAALRAEIAELGWPGAAVAEEHGGLGLGLVGAAILLEELGYAAAGGPLLASTAAAFAIAEAGSPAQRERWLPAIAGAEAAAALGIARDGVAELVPEAEEAAVIVLVEAGGARLLEAGEATLEPVAAIDPTRRYARVSGAGEPLPGDPGPALARASIAVAAELVGVCQRALDASVEFVKEREQFGQPIGAFQAVAHRCAEMLLLTEGARSAVYHGAWAADVGAADLGFAAALAKAAASDAAIEVTAAAIQVHGGIGFTWEADLHWLYKRAQVSAQLFGAAGEQRRELARLLRARATAGSPS